MPGPSRSPWPGWGSLVVMSWKPELEEIEARRERARQMGGEERVARHVAAGRLPVRERIDRMLDPGSFREVGSIASRVEYEEDGSIKSFTPSNFVTGRGSIDGRPVVIGGDDFSVRGGAADGAIVGPGSDGGHDLVGVSGGAGEWHGVVLYGEGAAVSGAARGAWSGVPGRCVAASTAAKVNPAFSPGAPRPRNGPALT